MINDLGLKGVRQSSPQISSHVFIGYHAISSALTGRLPCNFWLLTRCGHHRAWISWDAKGVDFAPSPNQDNNPPRFNVDLASQIENYKYCFSSSLGVFFATGCRGVFSTTKQLMGQVLSPLPPLGTDWFIFIVTATALGWCLILFHILGDRQGSWNWGEGRQKRG